MRLLSIGETATELGFAVATPRRLRRLGLLIPCCETIGGHRRYQQAIVQAAIGVGLVVAGKTI